MDPEVPGSSPGGGTISGDANIFKSFHARCAAHAAAKLGYKFTALDPDGYLFEVRDGARRAVFSAGAGTPYALNPAHSAAIARDKAFAQTVLARAGVPVIASRLFFVTDEHASLRESGREPADALAFAAGATYPVFCKPIDGSQGAFAEVIADAGQFARYMERVATKHYAILVQPVIKGEEHRVFVLNGRALFSYEKTPAGVYGDGVSTVAALLREGGIEASETVQAYETEASDRIYRAQDVPPRDTELAVIGAKNRAAGGGATQLTTNVEPHRAALALRCADALGLALAAVDLFENGGDALVIEVNSNPAIKTLDDFDRWDLIDTIWSANIEAALR